MAKTIDLAKLRKNSTGALDAIVARVNTAAGANVDGSVVKWMCAMGLVEAHTLWERYVENRLAAAVNHDAKHFISENNIKGVTRVSSGLAFYVVRSGGKFFDFRSMSELLGKADQLLGKSGNPFRKASVEERDYLDGLAAIRNKIVHNSEAARTAYRRQLRALYDLRTTPEPPEFLSALDNRITSPLRGNRRLEGLIAVVKKVIGGT